MSDRASEIPENDSATAPGVPPEPESSDTTEKAARSSRRAERRVADAAARLERRNKREASKAEREANKTEREDARTARRARRGVKDAAGELKRVAKEQARALKRESKDAARAVKQALKDDGCVIKPRRTQEERRETMRARLLDATVECLVKFGYSGASTPKICQQAKVSRGAQLHHFPTKESLIVASVDHLVTRRHAEFRQAMSELPEHVDRGPVAIDLLWKMISGDTFYAWLELSVAARTDPNLREAVQDLNARFQDAMHATFLEFFPDALGNPVLEIAPDFAFAVLEGLALRKIYSPGDDRAGQVLFAIKSLAGLIASPPTSADPAQPSAASDTSDAPAFPSTPQGDPS
jgi:AcrR family transcriptional regulator